MSVLIINQDEVRRLLPMGECIEVMDRALRALAAGEALQPLRFVMWQPDRSGLLGLMPGSLGEPAVLGVKVLTVFPDNFGTELDAHQGAVLLFDPSHGQLVSVMDATEITSVRTAAVSAVATRALARKEAADLAILGSGTQARTHLEAMRLVRPLERTRVWSRDPQRARRFAERESKGDVQVEPCRTAREAVEGADIICTVTASAEPVLEGAWISPGAHINAVGACLPTARELDAEAVGRACLFVDRRESALHEAGDLLIPLSEGALREDHIRGELGEVLTGAVAGRTGAGDITLFESLGLAIEDLAAAHHILTKAARQKATPTVSLGGRRA